MSRSGLKVGHTIPAGVVLLPLTSESAHTNETIYAAGTDIYGKLYRRQYMQVGARHAEITTFSSTCNEMNMVRDSIPPCENKPEFRNYIGCTRRYPKLLDRLV
jgi:hypothetical protein